MLLGIDERPSPVADAHVALSRPATPFAPTYMPSQGAQRCTSSISRRPHLGDSVPGFIAARRVRDTAPALTGAKVTAGSDGNLWFTEEVGSSNPPTIARIVP